MTEKVISVLRERLPAEFQINEKSGLIFIRDINAERGHGYIVAIECGARYVEAKISFENFAAKLVSYASAQLEISKKTLEDLAIRYSGFSGSTVSRISQDLISPEITTKDDWWLEIRYKIGHTDHDYNDFADILLCLTFLLFPYDVIGAEEGTSSEEISKFYERSRLNRNVCLAWHGYNCKACNVNMKRLYNGLDADFIHIHHLNPVSVSGNIRPDPVKDMVPLCPNCHSVAHKRTPPFTVEEIKNMIHKSHD
jgi:hypothetical protein